MKKFSLEDETGSDPLDISSIEAELEEIIALWPCTFCRTDYSSGKGNRFKYGYSIQDLSLTTYRS